MIGFLRERDNELVLAPGSENADVARAEDGVAFLHGLGKAGARAILKNFSRKGVKGFLRFLAPAEPHAVQHCVAVAQRKVHVPGARAGQVCHFPADPDKGKGAFQQALDALGEFPHA